MERSRRAFLWIAAGAAPALLSRGLGPGSAWAQSAPPELEKTYPDAFMFRDLPAYGLYVRHADGLQLDGIDLGTEQADARPAVVMDDVRRARSRALRAMPAAEGEEPLVWLRSVRDCVLDGLHPRAGTRSVVRLSGADTTGILLTRSDFGQVEQVATVDKDVPAGALSMRGNVMPRLTTRHAD